MSDQWDHLEALWDREKNKEKIEFHQTNDQINNRLRKRNGGYMNLLFCTLMVQTVI